MTTLLSAASVTAAMKKHRAGDREDISDARVTGLQLRVKPNSVRWSMRCRLHGRQIRYDLGPVVEGDEDTGGLSLATARERASRVAGMCRRGQNPETYLRSITAGVSVDTQIKIDAAAPKPSWTWEDAKARFLAEVERTNRPDTLRDYRGKLLPKELKRFDGRMVNTITRNEMAQAIEDIHKRGAEVMADGTARVVKRFFSWLAEPAQQDESGVADDAMVRLKARAATRAEVGQPEKKRAPVKTQKQLEEEERKKKLKRSTDAPPEIEIGRALVIAQQDYLPERIALGIKFLIGTCQRRRTVTGAHHNDFAAIPMSNSEVAWMIPPYFRKSGTKRGRKAHLVPVVGFAAEAVSRLEDLARIEDSDGWLFPIGKTTSADRPHAAADLLNDYLKAMPGVNWTPHGIRYALATYGERDLGFAKSEAKVILDHLEGIDAKDVTGSYYSSDPATARKREMMRAWTEWCEKWASEAIAKDRSLLDREHMMHTMFVARYGQKQFERRVALHESRGWPLWPEQKIATAEFDILQQAAE